MLVSLNYLCVDHKPRHPPKKRSFHKNRREEAQNSFESYLYKLRDLLNDGDRRDISEKLDESLQWLFDRDDLGWAVAVFE